MGHEHKARNQRSNQRANVQVHFQQHPGNKMKRKKKKQTVLKTHSVIVINLENILKTGLLRK